MSPKHQRHPNITQTSSSVFILLLWLWLTPKGCGSMSFYMDGSRSKSQIDKSGSRSGSNIFFFLYCTVCSNFSNVFSLFKNSYPRSETVFFYGSGYWKDTGFGSWNLNKSLPEIVQYKNIALYSTGQAIKNNHV